MKKRVLAVLICTIILAAGCGPAGTGSSGPAKDQPAAAEEAGDAGSEAGAAAVTEETGQEAAAVTEEADAQATAEKTADAGESAAAEKTAEEGEESAQAGDEDNAGVEAGGTSMTAAEEDSGQAGTEAAADQETEAEKKAAENRAKAEEKKKAEEEARRKFDEEIEGDYVPEGFSPYGVYNLVFDSGYLVKSRYSQAGLTFYVESEEFLFKLNRDLPDMTRNVAHLLFNNGSPMTLEEAAEEEFPFGESYVLQISMDDGSYYEVYRDQLDLHGRKFVRDIWESFREKYEGTF